MRGGGEPRGEGLRKDPISQSARGVLTMAAIAVSVLLPRGGNRGLESFENNKSDVFVGNSSPGASCHNSSKKHVEPYVTNYRAHGIDRL